MSTKIYRVIKMKEGVLVKPAGILEVNPGDAEKATAAKVVEVLAKEPYDWATKYLVFGELDNEAAIDAVINHSRTVASAYLSGDIDLGITVVDSISLSNVTASQEMKEYHYPVIIKA